MVQPQGGRSWRFDYRFQGTRKGISLGTYPEVSLAVARERRAEARRLVAEGLDPSRVRQAAKRGPAEGHTFDAVAAEWLAKQATKWAASTTEKATYHLSLPSPWIGRRPIASIEPPELLDVLRDIESRGHIETAHNVKQRVGQVFRYAIATGRATRDPSADLRGALAPISRQHRAALTAPDDIRTLLRAIAGYGSRVVHAALQMLPLVFVRPGELRLARWSEFTLDHAHGLWRIPADRMKHREPHLVPLSRQVVKLLSDLQRFTGPREGERPEDTLVFPSRVGRRTPISENTLNGALRRLGFGSRDMSAHGFRDRGTVTENGHHARLISSQERGLLRVIRDRNGRDVRTDGSMLLDGLTGELLRATMEPRAADLYSHLEVTFGAVDGVPRRVPAQMWEWYWQQGSQRDRYVEGLATYDSFRRFMTSVGPPHPAPPPR